jgi:hypothetical protein
MSTWTIRAYGAKVGTWPVTRSSNRMPRAISRSADWMALVDVLPAVHADEAEAERMRLVHGADAEQRVGDRDLGLLGQLAQLLGGVGDQDAVAGQDDRALGLRDLLGRELDLAVVAVQVGLKPGRSTVFGCSAVQTPIRASLVRSM